MVGKLESNLVFTTSGQDMGSHPSYEGVHDLANYMNVNVRDTPIGTEADDKGQAYSNWERY